MQLKLKLYEGNGLAALPESSADFALSSAWRNSTGTLLRPRLLIEVGDENVWIRDEVVAQVRPMNRPVVGIAAEDEAEILQHPEVVAAVDAALPDIEDWERSL